jgi:hypothetical protein
MRSANENFMVKDGAPCLRVTADDMKTTSPVRTGQKNCGCFRHKLCATVARLLEWKQDPTTQLPATHPQEPKATIVNLHLVDGRCNYHPTTHACAGLERFTMRYLRSYGHRDEGECYLIRNDVDPGQNGATLVAESKGFMTTSAQAEANFGDAIVRCIRRGQRSS